MLQTGRYLYVGFMCQQVVEKALKAAIARDCAEGEIPPKIHNLLKLAAFAGLFDKMSQEQQAFIKEVNPLNIEARYPEYKKQVSTGLNADICGKFISETEALLCWIKEQL
jgi:HEPN domain-containing protein